MADTFSIHGNTCTMRSWDGGRLNTKAHGPGTLVHTNGDTRQCTLNHGVVSGYSWRTTTSGNKVAAVFNTQGMLHGRNVEFDTDGRIAIAVYNNGDYQKGSAVRGAMCIQYI